jgi:1,2-beta-oligoglucan phosphorylase
MIPMKTPSQTNITFPVRVTSRPGLSFELNSNGSIRRIDHADIMINLFLGNEAEGGLANIHLRVLSDFVETIPLLGTTAFVADESGMTACGEFRGLVFRIRLVLAESSPAWFWHVELENTTDAAIRCDLIHTQDIGLAHYGAVRLNEFYVSQYVDHTPLSHAARGVAVASRQNQSMGGRCPWTVIGSLGRGVSHATDALQFHEYSARAGDMPPGLLDGLPGKRLQHEHSLVCIQDEPFTLAPGARTRRGFFGLFVPDKPAATAPEDASLMDEVMALPEANASDFTEAVSGGRPAASLFTSAPFLETLDLDETEVRAIFGDDMRHAEREDGKLLSFFTGERSHVVLRQKELRVLRPHGHLLRSGGSLTPDESALTSTAWMGGVFHSMVTQGHVSINRLLSTCHSYLGLFRSHGQRVFVETGDRWHLLGLPSAFAMTPASCRWIYRHQGGLLEIVSTAPDDGHRLHLRITVKEGAASKFLITHHVALNGDDGSASIPAQWRAEGDGVFLNAVPDSDVGRRFPDGGFFIAPSQGTRLENIGGDELLFADGITRQQPFLCLVTAPALTAGVSIEGRLIAPDRTQTVGFWKTIDSGLSFGADPPAAVARIGEMFPWFIQNALVHYLSPRGLEQYSGGGWGTRDVCQGAFELLLALGRFEPARDLLVRVFRQQNDDGDWPQWFMFFERERGIRPGDSHGDIVYWPVLALAQYLAATGDASLLDETMPFYHADGDGENATILQHIERAIDLMLRRVIVGTSLAAYGHGDWNDSLQPAKPDMRERLCSSWTVTLSHQTFIALAHGFRRIGDEARAAAYEAMAANILEEFQRVLIVDDVLAGLAYFHEGGRTDLLLHPKDNVTGLSYSLLAMIHAVINDMFSPRQAQAHLNLIRQHLTGPDGAHLFDRPMAYHGGIQTNFQRAESASYFGREIGIMYTHAHLRYCEALARFGDADGFLHALRQITPIALREIVPSAAPRQANCYYSSSDPAFADRYEAFEQYDRVNRCEVPLEGGWRVYSSGAGISVRLIMQCFLGLRVETSALVVDPVIPASLDGLEVSLTLAGRSIRVHYRINCQGRGPISVNLNGTDLDFIRETNPYRPGAARVSMEDFTRHLTSEDDRLTVWLE